MARPWLLPLVPLYAAGLAVKGRFLNPRKLAWPVVSIGSLSAGGAGKTPVVMMVVEMLRDAGWVVDVLSRGYGRSGKGIEQVDPAGPAARFGDEPMLLAQRLGVPVWVGADRYAAGIAAEAAQRGMVHVLDDGFQHRRLARDVDVVLLTQQDVRDSLLPAGNLREPLRALERADLLVLRQEEAATLRDHVPAGKAIWVVQRCLHFDREPPRRPLVFCAIARPQSFAAMLAAAGVDAAAFVPYPDHHAYSMRDVTRLLAAARGSLADGFVTTGKDMVKLTAAMRTRLEELGPVVVAELHVDLVEGRVSDLGLSLEGGT